MHNAIRRTYILGLRYSARKPGQICNNQLCITKSFCLLTCKSNLGISYPRERNRRAVFAVQSHQTLQLSLTTQRDTNGSGTGSAQVFLGHSTSLGLLPIFLLAPL